MELAYASNQSVVIDQTTQAIQATLERVEATIRDISTSFSSSPTAPRRSRRSICSIPSPWMHTLARRHSEVKLSRYTAHVW